ncbi:Bestrophin, RFP-TM, chloride channel-domain-containing protein [Amanita rubescens]|nr:Bestrophin, RFP-TM, chloride channel-domain-containing protein [Amanita rubescens]
MPRFAPRQRPGASFLNAVLATALFRCWHILVLIAAWSSLVTVLNSRGYDLHFPATLLTVIGTVLGFVISYRTTSSFERYNEGRRLWSHIILASRTFSRTVWFHVHEPLPAEANAAEKARKRIIIEKKTALNLLEAFAVAVKHYLRGEDGIHYQDLYYVVKFLPGYAFPAGRPSFNAEYSATGITVQPATPNGVNGKARGSSDGQNSPTPATESQLHQRSNTAYSTTRTLLSLPIPSDPSAAEQGPASPNSEELRRSIQERGNVVLNREEEAYLSPGFLPPKYHLLDLFPFSIIVRCLTKDGKGLSGRKAARLRAKLQSTVSHNIPLEISLYLSSYVATLQNRKILDVPTANTLLQALNQLVDSLTGLERILTTPIPFSYSVHLWVVTTLYCWAMPFQLWSTIGWWTIPATIASSFIYFGFLVAGEEIENPFGYDKNDLNLDHFTHNIIRNELRAVTSAPPPDPADWVFSPENDLTFSSNYETSERITPEMWMNGHYSSLLDALRADEPIIASG